MQDKKEVSIKRLIVQFEGVAGNSTVPPCIRVRFKTKNYFQGYSVV